MLPLGTLFVKLGKDQLYVKDREEISKYMISVFIVGCLCFSRLDAVSSMEGQQWVWGPRNGRTAT